MVSTAPALTYSGPKEVLVNQSTVLSGSYDPQKISTISLIAEDKFPLNVIQDPNSRRWEVKLERGFNQAGVRWMRLKGTASNAQVVSENVIFITVSAQPMNSGKIVNLKTLTETLFKVAPVDSSTLNNQQKVVVPAGQILKVKRYSLVDAHLKVELVSALNPVGDFGYFFEKHVQLSQDDQTYNFDTDAETPAPANAQLIVTTNTLIKAEPEDSSLLGAAQKSELIAGKTYEISGYAPIANHFRVTLTQAIPGFGDKGYVFSQHVQIKQNSQDVRYDANALTVTTLRNTVIKKRSLDSTKLTDAEKYALPGGTLYGVNKYEWKDGHILVSLTENFPNFGNIGYLFPDFVQLKRGETLISSVALTYQGPREVLLNKATVLKGTYDPQRIATVTLVAEDKFPFKIALNSSTQTWEVRLDKGFTAAGARWLRLKGSDRSGKVIDTQIIYLTVSTDPLTVGQALTLKVIRDTYFKVSAADTQNLNNQQKVLVAAGKTFNVKRYGYIDGHLKVELDAPISPVGDFGYFYEPAVQLSKGTQVFRFDLADVPNTDISAQMLVVQTTLMKAKPADSSTLGANQTVQLLQGQTFSITGYAAIAGHFRVNLATEIAGFGKIGYIYWPHVQIKKADKVISFDPNALTMTTLRTTILKKRSVDASSLTEAEKITLPGGETYGVDGYAIDSDHIKVALTEEFPNFGNTGYVFPEFVQFKRGGASFNPYPPQIELNVPYFSQRDNPRFYWSTCNVTSVAMVFYYYGIRPQRGGQLEDELLQWCFDRYGEGSQLEHGVISQLIRAYGFKTSFSTTRKWIELRQELASGRPVIVAGDFTASGHILVTIGYTPSGYIVNDPWGDALTGYRDTEGRKLFYSNSAMDRFSGPDGNIWAHFISR